VQGPRVFYPRGRIPRVPGPTISCCVVELPNSSDRSRPTMILGATMWRMQYFIMLGNDNWACEAGIGHDLRVQREREDKIVGK
jgi:hypothetical protein